MLDTKTEKLLALAFDGAAAEGEAVTAFLKARGRIGEHGGWFALKAHFAGPVHAESAGGAVPWPRWRFGFGKHRGELLAEVAESDPEYLEWLLEAEVRLPSKIRSVIEINILGGARR